MKTKVHKVTLIIVDIDGVGAEGVKEIIENGNYPNDCIAPKIVAIDTEEVDWSDGHPLNKSDTFKRSVDVLFGRCRFHETVAWDNCQPVKCPCGCSSGVLLVDGRNMDDNLTFLVCDKCGCAYITDDAPKKI